MKFETLQSFESGGREFAVKRAGVKEIYDADDSVAGSLIFKLLVQDGKIKVLEMPQEVEEVPADETVEQARAELAELLLLENPSKAKLKKIEKLKSLVGE
jgi:hypothetical protein